ncbi:MAG: hypothetical protein HRO68_06930 [Nitrosopumilus sp.]|nr:hypothetical protein [Nitrosopumilus sp.]
MISEGLIPPMLIGPKSFLILKQELTSMLQSRGSSTMNNDEQKAFSNLLEQRTQETLTLPDENKRNELLDIIEKIKKKHK